MIFINVKSQNVRELKIDNTDNLIGCGTPRISNNF